MKNSARQAAGRARDRVRVLLRWCRERFEPRRILLLWRGRRRAWWRPFRSLVVLAVMLLVGLTAFAAVSWWTPGEGPLRVDGGCSNNQFGCGALTEVAATVLALAFAFAVFAYWRVYRVVREHVKPWRHEPHKLVPTATRIEYVVGREGICEILEEDLMERKRRPQVIVGGIGDGKTAVLVRLAQRLVKSGAVPVGVRLRDAKETLDFDTTWALVATRTFLREGVREPVLGIGGRPDGPPCDRQAEDDIRSEKYDDQHAPAFQHVPSLSGRQS
jgi:hypothetical protein